METRTAALASPAARLRSYWATLGLPAPAQERAAFSARRYPAVLELLRAHPATGPTSVLDLGGGIGSLGLLVSQEFGGPLDIADRYFLPEATPERLAEAGVRAKYAVDLTTETPLAGLPSEYGLVLLVEVVEHLLVNPRLLLREIRRHLAPDGRLLLTTPNQARLRNRFRLALGRSIRERQQFPAEAGAPNGHVAEFTLGDLDELFVSEGFAREAWQVRQNLPSERPSRLQRAGVRLLNTLPARRLALGDDLLLLYRPGSPPAKVAAPPDRGARSA